MKKFFQIAESALSKTQLTRIRLKVDPKLGEQSDYAKFDGYEGYILAEQSNGVFQVFIISTCSTVDVPVDSLSPGESQGIDNVKEFVKTNCDDLSDQLRGQIDNCQDLFSIEKILTQNCSYTVEQIHSLYRTYIIQSTEKHNGKATTPTTVTREKIPTPGRENITSDNVQIRKK